MVHVLQPSHTFSIIMYCIIKYNDEIGTSLQADKLLYVNPDCALQILLDYIRNALGIEINQEFDLCDENGDLKNVNDYEPHINGTLVLQFLATYVCVLVERNEQGVLAKLVPLISNFDKQYSDFSLKLRRYVNPSRRFSYDMKVIFDEDRCTYDFNDFGGFKNGLFSHISMPSPNIQF